MYFNSLYCHRRNPIYAVTHVHNENLTHSKKMTVCVNCIFPHIFWSLFDTNVNRGSYSPIVLLSLLNDIGKSDKKRNLSSILSHFCNEFNKFNNTGARMLDSIYHMT